MEHRAKKTFEKINPKHVQTTFGQFWERFWAFLHDFFDFFEVFRRLDMEHWAKKIFKIITQKHVQNTFGHFWERFWAFLNF